MPDNIYTETIKLDNSAFVSSLQQAFAPLQEVIAGMQRLTQQLNQTATAQASGANSIKQETAALRENANALSDNAAKRRQAGAAMAEEGGGGFAMGHRLKHHMIMGAALTVAGVASRELGADHESRLGQGIEKAAEWGGLGMTSRNPYVIAAAAVAGGIYGAVNAKGADKDAAEVQKQLSAVKIAENRKNGALGDIDNSKEMESHIKQMESDAMAIRMDFTDGLIPEKERAKFIAIEASLERQIALAEKLKKGLELKEAKAEEEVEKKKAALDIDNHRTQMQIDAQKIRNSLASGVMAAMSSGGNSFTAQGFGTGTAVGAVMSGVETRVDRTNGLLMQIQSTLSNTSAPAGVFS
jgi:hypothetical protein